MVLAGGGPLEFSLLVAVHSLLSRQHGSLYRSSEDFGTSVQRFTRASSRASDASHRGSTRRDLCRHGHTIEDFGYAQRIARLRGYCFQYAPELVGYLLSVPPTERLRVQGMVQGMHGGLAAIPDRGRMVGVVTAVLAGSAAGLLAAVAALAWLMRHQRSAWTQVRAARHSPTTEGQLIRCS
jgi:hypothetical protein